MLAVMARQVFKAAAAAEVEAVRASRLRRFTAVVLAALARCRASPDRLRDMQAGVVAARPLRFPALWRRAAKAAAAQVENRLWQQ